MAIKTPVKLRNPKSKYKLRSFADEAWKESLDLFFKDFMELCWPNIFDKIDWDKGFEFLEQELQSIIGYERKGRKIIDKLIKVHQKNGITLFVLLHIEIQKNQVPDFSKRIFRYNYRTFDKYNVPVVSLGILIDSNADWRPHYYESQLWGCQIRFEFPILKLLDYKTQTDMLLASENPFAIVILSQLAAMETSYDSEKRLDLKFSLTKDLLKKNWSHEKIRQILKFLDGVLKLPKESEIKYLGHLKALEEETKVSYRTSYDVLAEELALEKGMEKGVVEGEKQMLLSILETKFTSIPNFYLSEIEKATPELLLNWGKRILKAESIQEVFGA